MVLLITVRIDIFLVFGTSLKIEIPKNENKIGTSNIITQKLLSTWRQKFKRECEASMKFLNLPKDVTIFGRADEPARPRVLCS